MRSVRLAQGELAMKTRVVEWLTVAAMLIASHVAAADAGDSLAGTWSLEERSSDDPVGELVGHGGDGLGRRIAQSVNVFGIPVGSLPLPGDGEAEEEPLSPEQVLGALAYTFEATYRLRIAQNDTVTEIRYGNAPTNTYLAGGTVEHDGWRSTVEWRDGELTIEHERPADGAHLSERYWVETRADELHWTVHFKRPKKKGTVDVKRVFYRAPTNQDSNLPLSAQLSP
jgi:hypothetical protein